jgi:signal transduction histidine kinase
MPDLSPQAHGWDQAAKLPEHELAVASAVGRAHDDRWHIRQDGSRLWATGATIAIRSPQGDLLGFGKMLRDRTDLRTQIESLKNTVRELAQALASAHAQAAAKGLQLDSVLPEVPILIDLDHDRFQQIVVNLLNNAIKHTPPGGAVWLKASTDSGHAVVKVEDNGSGIPPELQPTIFDLFTQGPGAAPERRGSGLGIGLALVKELVMLHRGTVAVRSEGLGKGSEFTVRLPLRHTSPEVPLA